MSSSKSIMNEYKKKKSRKKCEKLPSFVLSHDKPAHRVIRDLTTSEVEQLRKEIKKRRMKTIKSYKFTDKNGDGANGFHYEEGKTYSHPQDQPVECCSSGFHSSLDPLQALSYTGIMGKPVRLFEVKSDTKRLDLAA